jgi:hypothetical protein
VSIVIILAGLAAAGCLCLVVGLCLVATRMSTSVLPPAEQERQDWEDS